MLFVQQVQPDLIEIYLAKRKTKQIIQATQKRIAANIIYAAKGFIRMILKVTVQMIPTGT